MKVTIIRKRGKNETITRHPVEDIALFIQKGWRKNTVTEFGFVVVEVNNLPTYEKAVEVRDQAKKMPETLMCFLGASGKSVKIVCQGELFGDATPEKEGSGNAMKLPTNEEDIQQFHLNLYQTARRAYMNQFGFDIEYLEPRLDRTLCEC